MSISTRDGDSSMKAWEPTEEMVDAAFNAKPLPPMRANREHYRAALKEAFRVYAGAER